MILHMFMCGLQCPFFVYIVEAGNVRMMGAGVSMQHVQSFASRDTCGLGQYMFVHVRTHVIVCPRMTLRSCSSAYTWITLAMTMYHCSNIILTSDQHILL